MSDKISMGELRAAFNCYDWESQREKQLKVSRAGRKRPKPPEPLWRYVNGIRHPAASSGKSRQVGLLGRNQ